MIDKFGKKMEDEVRAYLTAMLGGKVEVEALSAAERKQAGWLVNFYALRAATMQGKRHVLAFAKPGQHYTPVAVAKQLAAGRDALGLPLVYVPRELGPHDIPRLIAANVPYVLPKRSLFLPEVGLSVTRAPETPVLRETFSAPAQLLVLGYILRKWDGAPTCFAMPLKGFRSLGIEELSPASAPCKLQLWHYPPTALGGDAIDPVSFYLSLQNEPDDRVQIELDKLEETFKW